MQSISLQETFPPLSQIYEITLKDSTGKLYTFYRPSGDKPESETDKLNDSIACEALSTDLSDIKETFSILTNEQREIAMHIYYMYKNNKKITEQTDLGEICESSPKIILQGPAGTGKSTTINFIEKLITWEGNKTSDSPETLKVLKCAFTAKAAVNIDGVTLNGMFSIPYRNTRSLGKKQLNSKKKILEDCVIFICDEISMVGERLMNSVNMRLQQIFENKKFYGDRFVLLVGDLYQIDPVQQKPIYPQSSLWTCCEFYELTKIIRQEDPKFINALNNFRDSKMTTEDMELLRSREVKDYDEIPDPVIHLFYLNKHVDDYNELKLNKSNEKEEIVNAIEDIEKWSVSSLRVKLGIRYMITRNMDVGDGLANNMTGIVKGFDYDENGCVNVIWMDFNSDVIGKKTRAAYFKKHIKPGFENWVPIHKSKMEVKLKQDPKKSRIFPNMFPLRAAEAITVHKSQGQTYHEGVCIHLTNAAHDRLCRDKSLQYVALTRVKRLEDLYIMGTFDFLNVNTDKFIRKENELNRLRSEKKLKLAYETFENKINDVIIFLNTGLTFNEHYQFIANDKWYGNASLLIFTETNTTESDKIEIPNFDIAFRSDDKTASRSGGGLICYKEASKDLEFVDSISDDKNKMYLTLLLFDKYLYIITGVKGDVNDNDFAITIMKWFYKHVRDKICICFIGNLDPKMSLIKHLNDIDFKQLLPCEVLDAKENNQCDMVFTGNFNIQQDQFGYYEYIPSSHKPIYVKLPPKFQSPKNKVCSANNENPSTSQQNKTQETMEVK